MKEPKKNQVYLLTFLNKDELNELSLKVGLDLKDKTYLFNMNIEIDTEWRTLIDEEESIKYAIDAIALFK